MIKILRIPRYQHPIYISFSSFWDFVGFGLDISQDSIIYIPGKISKIRWSTIYII
ncbi:MAG: hypothetical protein LBU27_01245 [Candidatus Peribacteria bacterium]|nr:hypothetical protein [Candidatus Peribacteria bacterium]